MSFIAIIRDLFRYNREFAIGAVLILIVVVVSGASFFSPYDVSLQYIVPPDVPPSWQFPLGTNSRGQDVFWQLTFAIRNSLLFGILVALISRIISLVVGLTAGYIGGSRRPRVDVDQRHLRCFPAVSDSGSGLLRLQGPHVVGAVGGCHGLARLAL